MSSLLLFLFLSQSVSLLSSFLMRECESSLGVLLYFLGSAVVDWNGGLCHFYLLPHWFHRVFVCVCAHAGVLCPSVLVSASTCVFGMIAGVWTAMRCVWKHCTRISLYLNPTEPWLLCFLAKSSFYSASQLQHFLLNWPGLWVYRVEPVGVCTKVQTKTLLVWNPSTLTQLKLGRVGVCLCASVFVWNGSFSTRLLCQEKICSEIKIYKVKGKEHTYFWSCA